MAGVDQHSSFGGDGIFGKDLLYLHNTLVFPRSPRLPSSRIGYTPFWLRYL